MKVKEKILLIGSGGLTIGQAGEFDFSGNQAIKSFIDSGFHVIILNPNIATVQTNYDENTTVYLLPLTIESVLNVIKKEDPRYINISFGGQTALNLGIELYKNHPQLVKHGKCEIVGTDIENIIKTENRYEFAKKLKEHSIPFCEYHNIFKQFEYITDLKYFSDSNSLFDNDKKWFVRTNNTLGGLGSKIINNITELFDYYNNSENDFIIEENLSGWKELEFEVLRDWCGNIITVCGMENVDPMGIHTGESIVVAPMQTIDDPTYQKLRTTALNVAHIFNIIGECNVQFALSPDHSEYRVIEINARLSRSSALASKATGYPIAYIAAKLQIGKLFYEIKNPMTDKSAFYEPSLDYIVCKIPKWDFSKFNNVDDTIGSSMQSVGEVMAIDKTFEDVFIKACRMSFGNNIFQKTINLTDEELIEKIKNTNPERALFICEYFKRNKNKIIYECDCNIEYCINKKDIRINNFKSAKIFNTIDNIYDITKINKWFLHRFKNIAENDSYINKESSYIKLIDTTAGEYPAKSNYCYITKNALCDDEINIDQNNKTIIVVGSGPYKIGSSVEFDWCCVSAIRRLKYNGFNVIVLNNNPETVSTDYNECDVMIFDEISTKNIRLLYNKFNAIGVLCSFGGQLPINLVSELDFFNINVLDANIQTLSITENRLKLFDFINELNDEKIKQPYVSKIGVKNLKNITPFIKYPVILKRPYILSGDDMFYISNESELISILNNKLNNNDDFDEDISVIEFIEGALEIDYDGIAINNGDIVCNSIATHIETAGIHSGDSTILLSAFVDLNMDEQKNINSICSKIISNLKHTGPFNIQLMYKHGKFYIIEVNLRASRTLPFVSKYYNYNFVDMFIDCAIAKKQIMPVMQCFYNRKDYYGIKSPVFSYNRILKSDPFNIIKMNSTGEIATFSNNLFECFIKSMNSVGYDNKKFKSILISSGDQNSKNETLSVIKKLFKNNCKIYATNGSNLFLQSKDIDSYNVNWDDAPEMIKLKKFDLVLNIPKNYTEEELKRDYKIRRACIDYKVPLITDKDMFNLYVDSLYNTYEQVNFNETKNLSEFIKANNEN